MDADEEKITGILRRLTSHAQVRDNRAGCPDEETLAVFLNDSLEDAAKTLVETHLANCSLCVAGAGRGVSIGCACRHPDGPSTAP